MLNNYKCTAGLNSGMLERIVLLSLKRFWNYWSTVDRSIEETVKYIKK